MNLIRLGIAIVAAAAVLAPGAGSVSAARAQDDQQSIVAGRDAFRSGSYPWYDEQNDSLQPVTLRTRTRRTWQFWDLGPVLNVLGWTFLGLLLATLIVLLIRYIRDRTSRSSESAPQLRQQVLGADQAEALPFLAERPRDDLLGQARRHYEQGNYSEAIIYLFSYQLLELDKFAVIRLAKGKTNRQYLREAARLAELRAALERTMLSFEGVFFGRRPLDRAGFEACWNALPEFERQLRAAT